MVLLTPLATIRHFNVCVKEILTGLVYTGELVVGFTPDVVKYAIPL